MKAATLRPRPGLSSRPRSNLQALAPPTHHRPHLAGRWIVDTDGKLTCKWDLK